MNSKRLLIVCIIACVRDCVQCSTFHHDTRLLRCIYCSSRMNKLQSGHPGHDQILTVAEMKLRAFFSATTSICVVALELRRLVARDAPTIAYPCKTFYCLLIPITSRGRPVFRVVSCYDLLCQDWIFCKHIRQNPMNFRIISRSVQVP